MGDVTMTVPTSLSLPLLCQHEIDASRLDKLLVELRMATDAIVHDDLRAGIFSHDGLPFGMGDEISHMLHAVHTLKSVFLEDILMGNMTVVAGGITPMRGMAPRGIIGCHDVAVDTG